MADANSYGTTPAWSDPAPHRIKRPTLAPGTAVAVGMIGLSIALGAATAVNPALGALLVAALAVLWSVSLGRRIVPFFHGTLIAVCIGLAFFGKSFAYIGVRPVYVSEFAFILAVATVLVSLPGARWRPIHLAMAVFMGWGFARTIPYVGLYGIDALRDAVIFDYAFFAFAVSMTVRKTHIVRLIALYRRWFPIFLLWVPIAAVLSALWADQLPVVPGSIVPIIVFKAGDTGVHLGAFGALMLLGLGGSGSGGLRDWVTWTLWFFALAMSSIISRGGMVAASMMATSVLFARSSARWASWILVGAFLFVVVALANPQVDIGRGRSLSVGQAVNNVASIFGFSQDQTVLEVTKEWRLAWWDKIVGYTVDGPYFWTGKGFGVNLADDDGFQVEADGSLRDPHNGHLNLLARGGIPMLALWMLVHVIFFVTLVRAAGRARAAGLDYWSKVVGWVFVYWLAALVNAAFDVYLEGPMGGIWFWSMIGVGIAVVGVIDDEIAAKAAVPDESLRNVSASAAAPA